MMLRVEHEIHRRRLGRNVGLGLVLFAFVVLMFGLTVVKVSDGNGMQAFDHVLRPELVPPAQGVGQ
ncbi:MAG: hypothetical protein FJX19_04375 [Alphaproteobacteria bacterium]|nr:hypothetical protein [Alphaproteobacteria bacterium]